MPGTNEWGARRAAGLVWGVVVLGAAVAAGIVVGSLGVLPFAVLPRGRRERWAMVGAQWWAWIVVRPVVMARPVITGDPALEPGEGALFLCNHRSWLDPVLLMAATRSNGLSKSQIFWLPFIGIYGYLAGAVFFDRDDKVQRAAARGEVMRLASGGHRIQVFPEGTRSRDGRLRERVYLRLAMDAYREGIAVVPCAVMHTERALPADHFAAYPFQTVRLDIGPARRPADSPHARAFAGACWDDVRDRVQRLEA